MKRLIKVGVLILMLPLFLTAQDDENWPSLSYLRSDYKAVSVVAHILIRDAEITSRVGGYENWRISAEVLESFKGKFRKGDVIEYFHGAEAGLKKEHFTGEKIVFLLSEHAKQKKAPRYTVLENSTLPHTQDRVRKLRMIRKSYSKRLTSLFRLYLCPYRIRFRCPVAPFAQLPSQNRRLDALPAARR